MGTNNLRAMKLLLLVGTLGVFTLSSCLPIGSQIKGDKSCYTDRFQKSFEPGDTWCEPSICGMCSGRFKCQITCAPTMCDSDGSKTGEEFCAEHVQYLINHHYELHVDPMGME